MDCTCEMWKKYIERLNAPEVFIQTSRPYIMRPYPEEGRFKFCPWCGSLLLIGATTTTEKEA